jgi:hypothetical protein
MFVSIVDVEDVSLARVLVTALKAHGFHPMEDATGLPGMPGVTGVKGTISIQVPEDEKADAEILAKALLSDMRG